eukprot:8791284-Pyramimonas_sp.AAC.1
MAMDVIDEDALKTAKQEPEDMEKELHKLGDYRAAKSMGAKQTEYLKAFGFVNQWSGNMQLFNVCRRNTG